MQDEGIVYLEVMSVIISETELETAPVHDGAEFISSALRATMQANTRVRQVVQQDIAHTLNCQNDALSFLWIKNVQGQEILECEIPDFRNALEHTHHYGMVAE